MNNILNRISVLLTCGLLFAISASAQISLRKALDYDGDGKADLAVFRPANNVWYINKSNNTGGIYQAFGSAITDYQVPGDYDGDGIGDIAVWRDTDGVWYLLRSQLGFTAIAFGTAGDEPVARDYDGDGKTDLAVVRRGTGTMTWYISGSASGFRSVQFGANTDYTAPGDYDGDGKFDIAVQRPGTNPTTDQGIFFILNSNGGSVQSVAWGFGKDGVVPGDYDGDGKTDIAVVREGATETSPISWYIRKSSNGQLMSYSFGATGTDLTVQNDYDGDGKTDVAVWRNTNGAYYILNSQSGTVTGTLWGAGNDFPIASYDTH